MASRSERRSKYRDKILKLQEANNKTQDIDESGDGQHVSITSDIEQSSTKKVRTNDDIDIASNVPIQVPGIAICYIEQLHI